ncbi:MAG: alpha/beta hydrolase family protein [Planctomycetota bacterium]|jgi:pimeloyl-ACP methyl ester carboxylesterase
MLKKFLIPVLALAAVAAGCDLPYNTFSRRERGLVLVYTGIEGRSLLNENICHGLDDGGVNTAIDLVDWTVRVPGAYLVNLRNEARNRRKAEDIADHIVRYRMAHPNGKVILVGQSGGAAMALWTAESLPGELKVDGIILLAAAVSPDYPLGRALIKSRRGIVSFHSRRDWLFLAAGTTFHGTMDGKHTTAAGMDGFNVPANGAVARLYERLFQVAWDREMDKAWNFGGHLGSSSRRFVARYVAPFAAHPDWNGKVVEAVLAGHHPVEHAGGR